MGLNSVEEIMDAVDSWIELPPRDQDKPFPWCQSKMYSLLQVEVL